MILIRCDKVKVDDWIALVLSESDDLFARTKDSSIIYFNLIASNENHVHSDFCEEELDKYYDTVYEDAMDEYYDVLYDGAMDDLYDQFYNGVIDDAYDDISHETWNSASSESYEQWSDANSAIYRKWSDESSYVYGLWSAINSAFCWNNNFDVNSIVAEYDEKKAEEYAERAEEEAKVYIDFEVLYSINSDGDAEVVGFSGEGNRITISSEYEGEDVVRIADSAFENCTMLESIIMWADIEEIGDSAFKGCTGLTEFSIPSETELIGHHAFDGCTSLETLYIWGDPDIGEYAFTDCVSLTSISIGSDTKHIGAHAFEGCTGITSLFIWGVEIIGDYAFAGCSGIEDLSIPSDVLSIGNHAFDGCTALTSVFVWGKDTAIGKDAFANCPNLDDAPTERGTVLECAWEDEAPSGKINIGTEPDPDFKRTMDNYEQFFCDYVDFMNAYLGSDDPMSMMSEYMDMMTRCSEITEELDAIDPDSLGAADLAYYTEVMLRINQKLSELGQ